MTMAVWHLGGQLKNDVLAVFLDQLQALDPTEEGVWIRGFLPTVGAPTLEKMWNPRMNKSKCHHVCNRPNCWDKW